MTIACPSCGAPAAGDPDGICNFCRAHLPKDPPPEQARGDVPPSVVVQQRNSHGCAIAAGIVGIVVLIIGGVVAYVGLIAARGVSDLNAEIRRDVAEAQAGGDALRATDGSDAPVPVAGPRARIQITGAETFDGTISIDGNACARLLQGNLQLTVEASPASWAVLAAPPNGTDGPGSYAIGGKEANAYVSVNKLVGATTATWGSLQQTGATGTITRSAEGAFDVTFANLPALAGPATGTVSGSLQLLCA